MKFSMRMMLCRVNAKRRRSSTMLTLPERSNPCPRIRFRVFLMSLSLLCVPLYSAASFRLAVESGASNALSRSRHSDSSAELVCVDRCPGSGVHSGCSVLRPGFAALKHTPTLLRLVPSCVSAAWRDAAGWLLVRSSLSARWLAAGLGLPNVCVDSFDDSAKL